MSDSHEPELPQKSEENVDKQTKELVKTISELPQERKEALVKELFYYESFSGPLPSPEAFRQYNEIVPDAGQRILAMAEKEQQIRADWQSQALSNERKRIHGSVFLGISLIIVAGIATWFGNTTVAISLGLVGSVLALLRKILDWAESRQGN